MKKASRVLLTRTSDENARFKHEFDDTLVEFYECSLINYKLLPFDWAQGKNYDYIIITSKFLAQNFPNCSFPSIKVLVVGEVSSTILKDKGYKIEFCAMNAAQIKDYIDKNLVSKRIIYLCSNYISTKMPEFVTSIEVYKVDYLQELSPIQITALKSQVNFIMFYSENCAKTLLALIIKYNLQAYINKAIIISISDKVQNILGSYCSQIVVKDNNEQMISYLKANL